MQILRKILTSFIFLLTLFVSCKSEGALTPEKAFDDLKRAYSKSDAKAIVNLLSKGSIDKISEIIKMISNMDEIQLRTLSHRFGVKEEKMKSLSTEDYISLNLSQRDGISRDILKDITRYKIIGIDKEEDIAVIRVENGMELFFVKEGVYWKFDMKEL